MQESSSLHKFFIYSKTVKLRKEIGHGTKAQPHWSQRPPHRSPFWGFELTQNCQESHLVEKTMILQGTMKFLKSFYQSAVWFEAYKESQHDHPSLPHCWVLSSSETAHISIERLWSKADVSSITLPSPFLPPVGFSSTFSIGSMVTGQGCHNLSIRAMQVLESLSIVKCAASRKQPLDWHPGGFSLDSDGGKYKTTLKNSPY